MNWGRDKNGLNVSLEQRFPLNARTDGRRRKPKRRKRQHKKSDVSPDYEQNPR